MKEIRLSNGMFAKVDDEDFERLNQIKWYARFSGKNRYATCSQVRKGRQKFLHMHHEVLRTDRHLDHKDGDGLNNQKENLRFATPLENIRNQTRDIRKKTSIYKGVCWHPFSNLWRAYIKLPHKQLSLGYYRDEVEAAKAYDKAAIQYFEEFARPNFIQENGT